MAETNVKINLVAQDKASQVFEQAGRRFTTITKAQMDESKRLTSSMSDYMNEAKKATSATDQLSDAKKQATTSTKGMFTAFTAATLAASAITKGIGLLKDQYTQSVKAANDYQSSMLGLSSAAVAFGMSAAQVRDVAISASNDGLVPLTSNAAALKDLLQTGMSLDMATTLLSRFKDEAAFGRASTIEYGQAVENLGQAYKTEQSMLGNLSGHSENFTVALERGGAALGKNVSQLTAAEREQVKYTEYLRAGNYTLGNSAEYAETAAGKQAKLNYQSIKAHIAIGTALQPAVSLMNQSFADLIQNFDLSGDGMKNMQANIVTLVAVVAQGANLIIGAAQLIVGALLSIKEVSLKPLEQAFDASVSRMINTSMNWQESLNDIASGASDARVDETKSSLNQMKDAYNQNAAEIGKQVDKENESFADSMRKRAAAFKESLTDMIIAHRDKSRSIQRDIQSENQAYEQQVAERKKQLAEDLADLETDHLDKVSDITKEITKEREAGIIVDGRLYANANQARIAELQGELDEENAAYETAKQKRQADAAEELAADQAKHAEKLTELQTSLNEELAVLQQHATDVAAVGEQSKEDDISRLKRKYVEENVEAAKQHQQRLADLTNQGSAQGAAYATAMGQKMNELLQLQTGALTNTTNQQGQQAAEAMRKGFFDSLARLPGDFGNWLETNFGAKSAVKSLGLDKAAQALSLSNPLSMPGYMVGKALGLFAEGGVINRPTLLSDAKTGVPYGMMAEAGPEAIVPMGGVSKGLPSGGGMSLAIGSVVLNNQMDATSLFRTAYWEMRR